MSTETKPDIDIDRSVGDFRYEMDYALSLIHI